MTALRIGVCLVIAFAVLAFGAVEEWSLSLLVMGAGVLLGGFGLKLLRSNKADILFHPLLIPLIGLCLVTLLQIVFNLSVYTYATRVELLKLTSYAAVAFVAIQSYRQSTTLRWFLWFLVAFGFLVAMLGILQHLSAPSGIYWLREVQPGRVPFGPFANRNHFAGLMEMLIPMGSAIVLFRGASRDLLPLAGTLTIFQIAALFLCSSRAGVIVYFCQMAMFGFMLFKRNASRWSWYVGLGFGAASMALVGWLGVDMLFRRFQEMTATEMTGGRRLALAKESLLIFADYPMLGTGLGTFSTVQLGYETLYDGKLAVHAHNDYLEVLAETGVVGTICCVVFLAIFYARSRAFQRHDRHPLVGTFRRGALVSCTGLLLHSLVDFNLRIPANALLFVVLAILATNDFQNGSIEGTSMGTGGDHKPDNVASDPKAGKRASRNGIRYGSAGYKG